MFMQPKSAKTDENPNSSLARVGSRRQAPASSWWKSPLKKWRGSSTRSWLSRVSESASNKTEVKIFKKVATMFILFVLSWSLFAFISVAGITGYEIAFNPVVVRVSYLFAKGSCIHSSVIYLTKAHRSSITRLFRRQKRGSTRSNPSFV